MNGRPLKGHQAPHHGATDVWLTPLSVIDALGPFDLDPCAAPFPRPWPTARRHITLPFDGLTFGWGDAFIWCNPPFSDRTPWLARMAGHRNGIALCHPSTETVAFVKYVWKRADAILFLDHRPHFHYPDGTRAKANCGASMCLVAYGATAVERLKASGLAGSLCTAWTTTTRQEAS